MGGGTEDAIAMKSNGRSMGLRKVAVVGDRKETAMPAASTGKHSKGGWREVVGSGARE